MASKNKWDDILTGADTAFATADFDPSLTDWSFVEPLIVGAGGIGCELLHLLALSGFRHLTVLDMDYVELSNLNRQFLFTPADIGEAKSTVAAAAVMSRCPHVSVTAVVGRLEDQPDAFYEAFDVVLLAVDSIPARRWINRKVAQLATRIIRSVSSSSTERTAPVPQKANGVQNVGLFVIHDVKPIIDTGTEGFEGHCRIINMYHNTTPCIECEMYLYNNGATRETVPLCTLESVPRTPEHCVLYAKMKEWAEERGEMEEKSEKKRKRREKGRGKNTTMNNHEESKRDSDDGHDEDGTAVVHEVLDPDNPEHVHWIAQRARERQLKFGIAGPPIDDMFALGVIKNVVPAVGFANAYVAGQAVTETLKWLTGCAPGLDNFSFYNGATEGGVFADVQQCRSAPTTGGGDVCGHCLVCGPRPVMAVDASHVSPTNFLTGVIALSTSDDSLREELRGGTASLRFQAGASGQLVEVALPRLPSIGVNGAALTTSENSLADFLCAAGHESFVREWKKGSQTAQVECFGSSDARIAVLVRWEA